MNARWQCGGYTIKRYHRSTPHRDVPAINSLADRTDGKVAQALIGDSEEDAMQVHTIVRKIVEPDAK